MKQNVRKKTQAFLCLHIVLLLYSLGGIFAKYAGMAPFMSGRFILCYGVVLLNLAFYAIMWQQVLKRIPLITAYANKAATIIWGFLWGMLIFGEEISLKKAIGMFIIISGVILVVKADDA